MTEGIQRIGLLILVVTEKHNHVMVIAIPVLRRRDISQLLQLLVAFITDERLRSLRAELPRFEVCGKQRLNNNRRQ